MKLQKPAIVELKDLEGTRKIYTMEDSMFDEHLYDEQQTTDFHTGDGWEREIVGRKDGKSVVTLRHQWRMNKSLYRYRYAQGLEAEYKIGEEKEGTCYFETNGLKLCPWRLFDHNAYDSTAGKKPEIFQKDRYFWGTRLVWRSIDQPMWSGPIDDGVAEILAQVAESGHVPVKLACGYEYASDDTFASRLDQVPDRYVFENIYNVLTLVTFLVKTVDYPDFSILGRRKRRNCFFFRSEGIVFGAVVAFSEGGRSDDRGYLAVISLQPDATTTYAPRDFRDKRVFFPLT